MLSIKKNKSIYYLYYRAYVIYKNSDKNTVIEVRDRLEAYLYRWGEETLNDSLSIVLEELGL